LPDEPFEVIVAGGGIAGLEATLAVHALAAERATITLVAPEREFSYRPMEVEEPFSLVPAARRDLAAIATELGGRFICDALAAVDESGSRVELAGGGDLRYDALMVCVGARQRLALPAAETLIGPGPTPAVNDLLARAAAHPSRRLAIVVPAGVTWPLPAYELALMAARRARELGHDRLETVIVSPEAAPLIIFGPFVSRRVYELLRARGVSFLPSAYATEVEGGGIVILPGRSSLDAGATVALPVPSGPRIPGLPQDRDGFIPIDDHARVPACRGVYAAGDGTTFPIKQGGIATQQADAAAQHIAATLGLIADPEQFRPVLRGKLLAGEESLHMRIDSSGGGGEGVASDDYLWWPPHKVAGLYLSPWLEDESRHLEPEPPRRSIEVEVALPGEWHREPLALDPYSSFGGH